MSDHLERLVQNERAHPGPTCIHLAIHRNNKYGAIPFGELIALALRARVADLQLLDSRDVKRLAEIASKKQYGVKGDFVKALSKCCRALDSQQQVAALFGNVTPLGYVQQVVN